MKAKPAKIPRSKVLPDNVHFWRGRRWKHIDHINHRQGEGLKKVQRIGRIITVFEKRKAGRHLTSRNIASSAQAIMEVASGITDEVILRLKQAEVPHHEWNAHYVECLRHFWKNMPRELRKEIIRQSKNEWDFGAEKNT